MLSPKAGMFSVASRRWKKSPKKKAGESTAGWESSDSDYVESEGEEEGKDSVEVSISYIVCVCV